MIRRRLTFGLVFLTAGTLLLLAAYAFDRGSIWVRDSEELSAQGLWTIESHADSEASDFAECATWAGFVSLTLAIGLLAGSAISAKGRGSFSGRYSKTH